MAVRGGCRALRRRERTKANDSLDVLMIGTKRRQKRKGGTWNHFLRPARTSREWIAADPPARPYFPVENGQLTPKAEEKITGLCT